MPLCSLLDVQQKDADHYEVIANIPTKPGARTARLVPEVSKYDVSVSTKVPQQAEILVYDLVPEPEFAIHPNSG